MINKDILEIYRGKRSIRATAAEAGVSQPTVRKVLITAGLYTSPCVERIRELSAAGMPPRDIAELLGVSVSWVGANTPYVRGTYLDATKSANALKIRKCRVDKARKG